MVKATEVVTPIATSSEVTGKRDFSDTIETEEEGILETAKNQNIEAEGELVQVVKTKIKKRKVKIKRPTFEMQQYEFLEVPDTSTNKFKYKAALHDKYKDDIETSLDEYLKLYAYVRKLFGKEVSLVTVKDHTKNTLNLVVSTKNIVAEMRLN